MRKKSSKLQVPSSKEAPNPKLQNGKYPALDGESRIMALKEEDQASPPFDLEERSAQFGENIVRFSKKIPRNPTNDRLIGQIAGAGTSVGANYCEANECVSKKDFRCSRNHVQQMKTSNFTRWLLIGTWSLGFIWSLELGTWSFFTASDWSLELGIYLELGAWNLELIL